MEIQVGAMLMHADRQMDMMKPVGAFRDYVNVQKKMIIYHLAHPTSMSRIIFSKQNSKKWQRSMQLSNIT
jgi:hypothetical protein